MYKLPHSAKLKGVKKIAPEVEIAVRLTARATFPLAIELIKFEMFPPGHAATKIIPRAMVGVGFNKMTNKKVIAGKRKVWLMYPMIAALGFIRIALKFS